LLGIARRKAGAETTCPHCDGAILVPAADTAEDNRTQLDDIDALLGAPVVAPSSVAAVAAPPTAPPPVPRSRPKSAAPPLPLPEVEQPLFERDLESVLGMSHHPVNEATREQPRAATTSGRDALSLGSDPSYLVLSPQKATALAVIVVVLLALSFTAGFLIASR
jgi:hypothetical protein